MLKIPLQSEIMEENDTWVPILFSMNCTNDRNKVIQLLTKLNDS